MTIEIEGLHKNALLQADPKDLAQTTAKIEIKATAAAVNIESARRNLKAADEILKQSYSSAAFGPDERPALQSKHRSLCNRFLKLVGAFEDMQSAYRSKYKKQLQRQYLLMRPDATQEELDQLVHSSQTSLLLKEQVFMQDTLKAKKALSDMKMRHEEILAIEKSMSEIHRMFSDISLIVQQQGDSIRRIEDYISQTSTDLEAANEEVKKRIAVERRRQIQRITLYSFGCLVLFSLIAIIINELIR